MEYCWGCHTENERQFRVGNNYSINRLMSLTLCSNCETLLFGTTSILVRDKEAVQEWADAARAMLQILEENEVIV